MANLIDLLVNGSSRFLGKVFAKDIEASGTIKAPTFIGDLDGNAGTATKLQTPRKINGVDFDGTKDINVELDTTNYVFVDTPVEPTDIGDISLDADKLGGLPASDYLQKTGGTMTGDIIFDANGKGIGLSNNTYQIFTPNGKLFIGSNKEDYTYGDNIEIGGGSINLNTGDGESYFNLDHYFAELECYGSIDIFSRDSGGITLNAESMYGEMSKLTVNYPETKLETSDFNLAVNSLSMGRETASTIGDNSMAFGEHCIASKRCSHAEGSGTTASGVFSHAEGYNTIASGSSSHAEGSDTIASGINSHAEGNNTIANAYQCIIGHYNDNGKCTNGMDSGTSGTAFGIGNGTGSTKSNAFRVQYDGSVIGKKAYSTTGADYAEFVEWEDGNLDNEDRRGYFVTLIGNKIKKANQGDFILGITSANPAVIGNNDECWNGQYLMDEFGAFKTEMVTEIDPKTEEEITYENFVLNPDYDPEKEYIFRKDRPEWSLVGMLGFISVRDDGTCEIGKLCNVGQDGIATKSDTGYMVSERITDNIVKVFFK